MGMAEVMRSFLGGTANASQNAPAGTSANNPNAISVPPSGGSSTVGAPGTGNPAPAGASNNPRAFDNGGNPPQQPAGNEGAKSAFDQFSDLWQIDPKQPQVSPVPNLSIDPNKLAAAVAQMNFTGGIAPEILQKALGGDAEALNQALNASAQAGFAQSLQVNSKMVEQALAKQAESLKALLPNEVKKMQVGERLAETNPVFANPVVAPFVDMLKTQLAVKHPNASGNELTAMATALFSELANEIKRPELEQQKLQQTKQQEASSSTLWDSFFAADSTRQ